MTGFNFAERSDIERVLRMVHQPTPRKLLPDTHTFEVEYLTHGFLMQTPASGIPARSSTTPGKAQCTPYYIDVTNSDAITELTDDDGASQSFDVYNVSGSAVAGSVFILAKRVYGVLVADMEDCS
jgi:hypothetical protein